MTECLEQASQFHEMHLEVMSLNPGWVELWVHSTSVSSCTLTKHFKSLLFNPYSAEFLKIY